jgi:hypothetical protein
VSREREPLNEQWCEFHWAPYRDERPRPNAVLASVRLMHLLVNLPRFSDGVKQKMRVYGMTQNEAAQMTMEDMCRIEAKSICCILGDATMSALLEECRGATSPKPSP